MSVTNQKGKRTIMESKDSTSKEQFSRKGMLPAAQLVTELQINSDNFLIITEDSVLLLMYNMECLCRESLFLISCKQQI